MAAFYTFEDYSGSAKSSASENPYDGLLEACQDDPKQIQAMYDKHRTNRAASQRAKLLANDFPGVTVDEILARLEDKEPGYQDPRHCLVFWARPPKAVRSLIAQVQQKLLQAAPTLWTMPQPDLHMTALEITHSLTADEIEALVEQMLPRGAPEIVDYTYGHRARLVKPMVSYDAQAIALSFLPAAGEGEGNSDVYSYHHLRRDLYTQAQKTGVKVASRYVVPSAHLTIGRFITKRDFETEGQVDHVKVAKLVETIEDINTWLEDFWPKDGMIKDGGEWLVGAEKGLEFRKGALWYGSGGETVRLGKGF